MFVFLFFHYLIEGIFNLCNGLAGASLVTYKVIPITTSLGMLEYIDKTSTLQDLVPKLSDEDTLKIHDIVNGKLLFI